MNIFGKRNGRDWVAENFATAQELGLDNALKTRDNDPYDGGTSQNVGTVGVAVVVAKEPEVVFDIDVIANTTDAKYSPNLIRMAQLLRDMRVAYSLHASEFAKILFAAQDELKLTEKDVEKAIGYIIKQREVVNNSAIGAIQVVAKNSKVT